MGRVALGVKAYRGDGERERERDLDLERDLERDRERDGERLVGLTKCVVREMRGIWRDGAVRRTAAWHRRACQRAWAPDPRAWRRPWRCVWRWRQGATRRAAGDRGRRALRCGSSEARFASQAVYTAMRRTCRPQLASVLGGACRAPAASLLPHRRALSVATPRSSPPSVALAVPRALAPQRLSLPRVSVPPQAVSVGPLLRRSFANGAPPAADLSWLIAVQTVRRKALRRRTRRAKARRASTCTTCTR